MKLIVTLTLLYTLTLGCRYHVTFPNVGGYTYPVDLSKVDTNHPFINVPEFRIVGDSFCASYYGRYWQKAYGEPNLSLRPLKIPLFRLTYRTAFGEELILNLSPTEIVVKELIKGSPYPFVDTLRLTKKERFQYDFLSMRFRNLFNTSKKEWSSRTDSLMTLYPEMQSPAYYEHLLEKAKAIDSNRLKFTTTTVLISERTYFYLIDKINKCKYWSLPSKINCKDDGYADGDGITLEANTPTRYNFVSINNCYSEFPDFSKACQFIIQTAGFSDKIHLVKE